MRIVAVHGYPLDRRLWGPLTLLAGRGELGAGVSVFAPDLRGRGSSTLEAREVHPMALHADDLAAAIEESLPPGDRFVLCGLSMGGYVALRFLERHRRRFGSRLAAVALFDSKAPADDEKGKAGRRAAADAIGKEGMKAALDAMLPKLFGARNRGSAAEETTRRMILETPPATAQADLLGMAERPDGFAELGALDVPFLAVVGEEDVLTPPAEAEAMCAAATHAPFIRLVTVPGAGHMVPLEAPAELAEPLADLIRRAG
jgi:pimeloyl-ACP methyl ester carboxylesterase